MLLANPCETIFKKLKVYLNKKLEQLGFGAKGNMRYTPVYDMKGLLAYILKQSSSIRTLEINHHGVLNKDNDMGLTLALEELNADPDTVHKVVFSQLSSQREAKKSQMEENPALTEFTFTITQHSAAQEHGGQRSSIQRFFSRKYSHCNNSCSFQVITKHAALYRCSVPP